MKRQNKAAQVEAEQSVAWVSLEASPGMMLRNSWDFSEIQFENYWTVIFNNGFILS